MSQSIKIGYGCMVHDTYLFGNEMKIISFRH